MRENQLQIICEFPSNKGLSYTNFISCFIFRLKDWIAKKADREKEKQERKKAKLEKLCQETKHEFHDPTYDKQRSEISDKVYESVEKG